MADRLVGVCVVIINGARYETGAESSAPGQIISCEIVHRDNEASQLTLIVWDAMTDKPYPEFNRHPNPRRVKISAECWAGWEGEALVKMFSGFLCAKTVDEEIPSTTKFVATQEAGELSKYARNHVLKDLSVLQMLRLKAKEHGVQLEVDPSAASDPWLHEPMSHFYQVGEPNWHLMKRYIRELGYVTINKGRNRLILTRDKSTGRGLTLAYGDEKIKRFAMREEQKRDSGAPKRKGHHHEGRAGQHARYPQELLRPDESGRGSHWVPAPLAKNKKDRKMTLAKAAVMGKRKRRQIEGDELDVSIRLEPWMVNHELITVTEYGPDINGVYHTRMVRHVMGPEWTTTIEAVRP